MGKIGKRNLKLLILAGAVIFIAFLILGFSGFLLNLKSEKPKEPVWGVTFSKTYAQSFGLDWRAVYLAILDDLGVRRLRIPVYWNDIEPKPGDFHFEDYDWMLNEADKRGAKIILGVGRKLPRWPECHMPDWTRGLTPYGQELHLLGSLHSIVKHFRESPAVIYWQVENEALFHFGICPKASSALLKKEADIVRGLDTRPIVITDSGELSTWIRTALIGDILGISMYRVTWNGLLGYFYFPITPGYYKKKAEAVSKYVEKVIVTELQAESWGRLPLTELPMAEQYQSMNMARFRANLEFARRTQLSEVYLWGAEWWYWLKEKKGNALFWEEARRLWH